MRAVLHDGLTVHVQYAAVVASEEPDTPYPSSTNVSYPTGGPWTPTETPGLDGLFKLVDQAA